MAKPYTAIDAVMDERGRQRKELKRLRTVNLKLLEALEGLIQYTGSLMGKSADECFGGPFRQARNAQNKARNG